MTYSIKEIFYTLQGEGQNAGRPAVFCRFAGCNLWSGLEKDRGAAVCRFGDTDFVGMNGEGGGRFPSSDALADAVAGRWPAKNQGCKFVVCTGGEPLLQVDEELITALHERDFEIAVETNGTIEVPPGIDWVCVSPKGSSEVVVRSGNELKFVYPQPEISPSDFLDRAFDYRYIQPKDCSAIKENTRAAINYCLANPNWSLSLQTHKILDIP